MADEMENTGKHPGKSAAQLRAEAELVALDLEIKRIELETKQLDLEDARDRNQRMKADKADRARKNSQRQAQLATDRAARRKMAKLCSHRSGASPGNPYEGDDMADTTLLVALMPDGFTKLILCYGPCRLRMFSPHPVDGAKACRAGESAKERDARVKDFLEDQEEFDRLLALAKKKKSPEARAPMDCGVTISVTNEETGMPVLRQRPCDSYAA